MRLIRRLLWTETAKRNRVADGGISIDKASGALVLHVQHILLERAEVAAGAVADPGQIARALLVPPTTAKTLASERRRMLARAKQARKSKARAKDARK